MRTQARVTDVVRSGDGLAAVVLDDGERVEGDVFVETTGSFGPQNNCTKFGNGCAMCVMRCPTFGGRVSVAAKAGIAEQRATKHGRGRGGDERLLQAALRLVSPRDPGATPGDRGRQWCRCPTN